MIERLFAWTGYLYTVLMAYGVAALWLHPDSLWGTRAIYAGLVLLILTPVSRVVVSCARYVRAGDRSSAWLTLGILAVILISAMTAWSKGR